ncbi:hypothetical protein CXF80_18120 [Shewanella sp. Actino-trap-3]|uniref:hypothetical protein n=1 Tax=Shewanella sp. Actino-trap-3 TaxID=2058331 RepID=UPI000C345B35|nr:hypothetical protein [Shewanella sp. Actino-trap-3]PKG80059.1 hypothetical protein CXF80_18120 [Shewanella sp. Actino-trap-3]
MIRVKYEYEGNKSEFDLKVSDVITNHKDVNELIKDHGHLENEILIKAAEKADSSKELGPHKHACERGGERQLTSDEIEAKKFGFTLLSYEIDNTTKFILNK